MRKKATVYVIGGPNGSGKTTFAMTRQHLKTSNDALHAMQKAVRDVISDRRRAGRPIFVLRDGKVVKVFLSVPDKKKKR